MDNVGSKMNGLAWKAYGIVIEDFSLQDKRRKNRSNKGLVSISVSKNIQVLGFTKVYQEDRYFTYLNTLNDK